VFAEKIEPGEEGSTARFNGSALRGEPIATFPPIVNRLLFIQAIPSSGLPALAAVSFLVRRRFISLGLTWKSADHLATIVADNAFAIEPYRCSLSLSLSLARSLLASQRVIVARKHVHVCVSVCVHVCAAAGGRKIREAVFSHCRRGARERTRLATWVGGPFSQKGPSEL